MKKIIEIWFPIKNFSGYFVSNLGKVSGPKSKNLSLGKTNSGYPQVRLFKSKKPVYRDVHRLVLIAFKGEPPTSKHECNHIDGNKQNNCDWNLEWVTRKENMRHAVNIGLFVIPSGYKNHRFGKKVTEETKEKMRIARLRYYGKIA